MPPANTHDLFWPEEGRAMHQLAARLFPLCRSLTGQGVRETLGILQELLPELVVHEVPTGTPCFDWTVPNEWNLTAARLTGPDGEVIADAARHNLHVVGYSTPVDTTLTLEELQPHLHSLPHLPHAIPYVTSYYREDWGFCLPHAVRERLEPGAYHARIQSTLQPGHLSYGALLLPGESQQEVFLSTYICHPSMANNELSGPVVAAFLARWVAAQPRRRYGYRFVFLPETIGSILYLSQHLDHLRQHMVAGFNLTCLGDERAWSWLPTRAGNTLADNVALHVLGHLAPGFVRYSFLDRGSDERQYNAPGVDLPVTTVMRSKYGTYPEYHTSLDDLSFITPTGLGQSWEALRQCLLTLEHNRRYAVSVLCEPQMGRRGLYAPLGGQGRGEAVNTRMNLLCYCDGQHTLLQIAEKLGQPMLSLVPFVQELLAHGLIAEVNEEPGG